MDATTVLHEVDAWPLEDRIRFVEALWDRIMEAGGTPEPTEAQRTEPDRRLAALEANPDEVVPWAAVQERARHPE